MKALRSLLAGVHPVGSRRSSFGRAACVLALWLPCALVGGLGTAATIHVPADQPTIQLGINAATRGDTVLVASGRYAEHDLLMKSGICLRSESGSPESVTIDAESLGRVLWCSQLDASTRIEGFTITGGHVANGYGGGIYCVHADLVIARCILTGNLGYSGGSGIYCVYSSPAISECVFSQNIRCIDGGALYCNASSSPTVSSCVFWGNSAMFWGGAVFCQDSSPRFTGCTIVGNGAHANGGGLWCVYRSHPVIENSIIAFSNGGEGIYVYENHGDQSDVTVSCSDVFGNADGNYGGVITDPTGTDGDISEDPRFCNETPGDFHLYAGSPCLPEYNLCGVQIGALGQACGDPTAVIAGSVPGRSLNWRFVNPAGSGCRVELDLPSPRVVSLTVYDAGGRMVRSLLRAAPRPTGRSIMQWDGRSDSGIAASPGLYFFRLQADGQVETRKAVHLGQAG
jgi:hypothetical protein